MRWAALLDDEGRGLLVAPDAPLSVTALHYTPQDLERATHTHELRPRRNIVLCVDYAHCGLGNASCGPPVLDEYRLDPEACRFGFSLRPYAPERGDLHRVARERPPDSI